MTRRGTPEADLQRAVVQALRVALPRTAIIHHCANEVTPLLWFLPCPERMRGGAARHFLSDWPFHRGIQAEATCRAILGKFIPYQRLTESRSWRAGFFCGIHLVR